jgi:hypothetical protein
VVGPPSAGSGADAGNRFHLSLRGGTISRRPPAR